MTAVPSVPPALVMLAAALCVPLLPKRLGILLAIGAPAIVLAWVWLLPTGTCAPLSYLLMELSPVRLDSLARLFVTVFAIMASAGALFAATNPSSLERASALAYAGGAVGVVMAGDLITLFVFWELMAVASTAILWAAGNEASRRAAFRYLLIHLLGGALLLGGISAHVTAGNGTSFEALTLQGLGPWLILAGILVNVAAPPVSAWLPDAYPEASWSGTVFLSAFTTKTAVYTLLRGFPGAEILIFIGLWMIFYGIIYALLENDMRRILAYSIVNQVGFMVTGIGIGTELSLNGAAAHAFAHIIYKALLLMSAGSVLLMTGRRKCSELGGLFQSMPLTTVCGIVGAISISSFPLTSGFVSKPMIIDAAADLQMQGVWLLLTAASAGVFLHAGIKFPWFVFFQRDSGLRPPDPPFSMRAAMVVCSAICLGLGIWPSLLYSLLPFEISYDAYASGHVIAALQLLLFSGLAFFVLLPMMKRTETITLDTDWVYRRGLKSAVKSLKQATVSLDGALRRGARDALARLLHVVHRHHGPEGVMARTVSSGSMAFWVVITLAGYLLAYQLAY